MLPTALTFAKGNREKLPAAFAGDDIRFSDSLAEYFIERLTDPGDVVLDPFCGFGTTLLAAERLGRAGVGVEIDPVRADHVRSRLRHPERLIVGDAREVDLPPARLLLTSPPYTAPGDPLDPLAGYARSSPGYEAYLSGLAEVVERAGAATTVIEASNLKADDGTVTTLAWDIAREVGRVAPFRGEIVVTWQPTYGYGYDHSYCLVFGSR